jgi:hypothetical protein
MILDESMRTIRGAEIIFPLFHSIPFDSIRLDYIRSSINSAPKRHPPNIVG